MLQTNQDLEKSTLTRQAEEYKSKMDESKKDGHALHVQLNELKCNEKVWLENKELMAKEHQGTIEKQHEELLARMEVESEKSKLQLDINTLLFEKKQMEENIGQLEDKVTVSEKGQEQVEARIVAVKVEYDEKMRQQQQGDAALHATVLQQKQMEQDKALLVHETLTAQHAALQEIQKQDQLKMDNFQEEIKALQGRQVTFEREAENNMQLYSSLQERVLKKDCEFATTMSTMQKMQDFASNTNSTLQNEKQALESKLQALETKQNELELLKTERSVEFRQLVEKNEVSSFEGGVIFMQLKFKNILDDQG